MNLSKLTLIASISMLLFSCVSSKKFKAEQARYETLNMSHVQLQSSLKNCEDEKTETNKQKAALQTLNLCKPPSKNGLQVPVKIEVHAVKVTLSHIL